MCDHRDLPVLTPSFPTRRSSYLADHRAHLREHGYVSIAFLWIGTDQCLQSVNDLFGVIEPSEHQCVRVALFIGIGMLCRGERSEEHTSELQSLMRISYAVFCLKKKTNTNQNTAHTEYR